MAIKKKIVGRFCEVVKVRRRAFDPRSFRWKKSGSAWILVGCPLGRWRSGRCAAGTRAHVVLEPQRGRRCRRGARQIEKG